MRKMYTGSIDYLLGGMLTVRNGRIDQYQFEEGYCQAVYINRDNYSSVFFRTNSLANPLTKGGKYQTLKPKEGYVYTHR